MDMLQRVLTFKGHEVQTASDVDKIVNTMVTGIFGGSHKELASMRKALHCMFVILRPQRFGADVVQKAEAEGEKLLSLYSSIEAIEAEGEYFKSTNGLTNG